MTVVSEVMSELAVGDIPVVAIAKGPERDAGRERFFMEGRRSFMLKPDDPVLYFLQRLRDEAHRFALKNHRHQRTKRTLTSQLDKIPGVGPKRRNVLLQMFGSVQNIKTMGTTEIASVPGFSLQLAESILNHLNKTSNEPLKESSSVSENNNV